MGKCSIWPHYTIKKKKIIIKKIEIRLWPSGRILSCALMKRHSAVKTDEFHWGGARRHPLRQQTALVLRRNITRHRRGGGRERGEGVDSSRFVIGGATHVHLCMYKRMQSVHTIMYVNVPNNRPNMPRTVTPLDVGHCPPLL